MKRADEPSADVRSWRRTKGEYMKKKKKKKKQQGAEDQICGVFPNQRAGWESRICSQKVRERAST